MKQKALVCLILGCGWFFLLASRGIAKEPADALVSVVSLDEQGNPMRQGMGIIVSREGGVLTSGGILADCRSGVVKTADGALHIIQKISRWDSLQELALLQIEMIPSMEKAKLTARRRLGYSQLRWQKNKCMKAGNYENRNLVNRSPEPIDHVSASSG